MTNSVRKKSRKTPFCRGYTRYRHNVESRIFPKQWYFEILRILHTAHVTTRRSTSQPTDTRLITIDEAATFIGPHCSCRPITRPPMCSQSGHQPSPGGLTMPVRSIKTKLTSNDQLDLQQYEIGLTAVWKQSQDRSNGVISWRQLCCQGRVTR